MKRVVTSLLLVAAVLSRFVNAGDMTYWSTTTCWETESATTIWSVSTSTLTVYSTTTSVQLVPTTTTTTEYKTIPTTTTETDYKTIPTTTTETDYKTIPTTTTTTEYKTIPTTVTSVSTQPTTITSIQTQPVTIISVQTQPVTVTSVQTQPVTITSTKTLPTTIYVTNVSSATIVNSQTIYTTISNTVTQTNTQYRTSTAVSVQYGTATVTQSISVTLSGTCPANSGITLCPTRIINPTYTPATPLPSTYLWGCPPGYICQPTKVNCNFEQGPPANSYLCPPEQCQIAGPLPPLQQIIDEKPGGTNCAWVTPHPGYFDLDPRPYGYTYAIFNIFGQPQCPASCPPLSTVTVTKTVSGGLSSSSSPSSSSSSIKSSTTSSVSTWDDWSSPAPKVTARAILQKRLPYQWPMPCFDTANYAQQIVQSIGSDSGRLCPTDSPFSSAFSVAMDCAANSGNDGPYGQATLIDQATDFCAGNDMKKRMVNTQLAIMVTSSETTPSPAEATPGTGSGVAYSSITKATAVAAAQSSAMAGRTTGQTSSWFTMLTSLLVFLFGF